MLSCDNSLSGVVSFMVLLENHETYATSSVHINHQGLPISYRV